MGRGGTVRYTFPTVPSSDSATCGATCLAFRGFETGILLPNNQRQHRTSHAPKDLLPFGATCVAFWGFR